MKQLHKEDPLNKVFFSSFKEYRLSKNDIDLVHELIKKAFIEYNNNLNKDGYKLNPLCNYENCGFLLTPSINKGGETIVFVNGYCGGLDSCTDLGTLAEWFEVRDGGNSMIRIVLNLSKKTSSNVIPNGEA